MPSRALGLLLTLAVVAVPLLGWLGESDVDNDEAIYSYAVERILDTGEWLTPRGIPHDGPFLEKPPLKFWLVAGGMRAGILPRTETGLRAVDALFALGAMAYVYLIGARLGGVICGVVAALILVTLEPLVFDHGLRSNNMESAVFLCYCGGMYHAAAWLERREAGRRHAFAVAVWFTLGFLAKFVAALFLPLVVLLAAWWRPGGVADVRGRWREWLLPAALVIVLVTPWFVYESLTFGDRFWEVILGIHVYQRFAGILDPNHLKPWHYYFSTLFGELGRAGTTALFVAGAVRLTIASWRGDPWLARLVLLWGIVPMLLMSFGTSKLLHYAYPFFPPVGLAGGYAASWLLGQAGNDAAFKSDSAPLRYLRLAFVVGGLVAAALALATAMHGRVLIEWSGIVLLRNSSAWRPAVLAMALIWLWVYGRTVRRVAIGGLVVALLPLSAYADRLHRMSLPNHPIRATRDCMMAVDRQRGAASSGILSASGNVLHHSFYYYLWRTGPYVIAPVFEPAAVIGRLTGEGERLPVILRRSDYERVAASLPPGLGAARYVEEAVLFPPPYAACGTAVVQAGGAPVWSSTLRDR